MTKINERFFSPLFTSALLGTNKINERFFSHFKNLSLIHI